MTNAKPPDAPAANTSPQTVELNAEAEAEEKEGRLGTILMAVAVAGIAVLVLDVALKGKLLAPLFALLPAPKPTIAEEPGDGGAPAPGE